MSEAGPTREQRQELVRTVRKDPALELVDFTRDGYKTVIVSAASETAASYLTARAEAAGYEVRDKPDGQELVLETPEDGGPREGPVGGNRLMSGPLDRILTWVLGSKKAASRQEIIGPTDEPVPPRFECSCGARYYGEAARDTCLGYHLIDGEMYSR